MRMYGVPENGKRVTFTDGLSLHIPFGVAYGKDEDGKYSIVRYQSVPAGYRNGDFTVEDGEEILWRISGLQRTAVIDFASDEMELTPESVQRAILSLQPALCLHRNVCWMEGRAEGPGAAAQ